MLAQLTVLGGDVFATLLKQAADVSLSRFTKAELYLPAIGKVKPISPRICPRRER